MNADLIAAAVLMAPGVVAGAVCLTGHHINRRHLDAAAAVCAEFRPTDPSPEPPPKGRIKAPRQTAPRPLTNVIDLPTRRNGGGALPTGERKSA